MLWILLTACAIEIPEETPRDCETRTLYYADMDGDGYGDSTQPWLACSLPDGAADAGGDCDDTDASLTTDCSGGTDDTGSTDDTGTDDTGSTDDTGPDDTGTDDTGTDDTGTDDTGTDTGSDSGMDTDTDSGDTDTGA